MHSANHSSTIVVLRDDLSRMSTRELGKRLVGKIRDDKVTTLSAAFAYHLVFSIPPLTILVVMIAALLNRVTSIPVVENLRDLIERRAPLDTQSLLNTILDQAVTTVDGDVAGLGAIVTAIVALWAGSNAVSILITGFNVAHDVEEDRPFVRQMQLRLGLTVLLVLFVNLAVALLVFGHHIGRWFADWVGFGSLFNNVWAISRWPAAVIGIMVLLTVLYWAGPNINMPFRWVTVGSLIATLLWLVVVAGFGLFLDVSNPGSAYGVVGSVIVLLFFLYITGLVFFLGAEINAILLSALPGRTLDNLKGPAMAAANQ